MPNVSAQHPGLELKRHLLSKTIPDYLSCSPAPQEFLVTAPATFLHSRDHIWSLILTCWHSHLLPDSPLVTEHLKARDYVLFLTSYLASEYHAGHACVVLAEWSIAPAEQLKHQEMFILEKQTFKWPDFLILSLNYTEQLFLLYLIFKTCTVCPSGQTMETRGNGSQLYPARAACPWLDPTGLGGHHRRWPSGERALSVVHGGGGGVWASCWRLDSMTSEAPFETDTPWFQNFSIKPWGLNRYSLLCFLF